MQIEIPDEDIKLIRRILWRAYLNSEGRDEMNDSETYFRLDEYFDNGQKWT